MRDDMVSCIQVVYKIPYRRAPRFRPSASREQRYLAYKYTSKGNELCVWQLLEKLHVRTVGSKGVGTLESGTRK